MFFYTASLTGHFEHIPTDTEPHWWVMEPKDSKFGTALRREILAKYLVKFHSEMTRP